MIAAAKPNHRLSGITMNAPIVPPPNRTPTHGPFRSRLIVFAAMAAALTSPDLSARAAPTKITIDQARAAAAEIAQLIESHYVFAEKRQPIAQAIRTAAAAHHYDTEDPYTFADRLTDDLKAAGHDEHLGVKFDPDQAREPGPHQKISGPHPEVMSAGRRRNEGFEELKILPGNIRYLKITNFLWTPDVTASVIDEVARFLGDGDAVIIDLRGNGGGNADAVARLISYFMKNDDQTLMTFFDGMSGEVAVTKVLDDLRGPRMVGKPLYTLIDEGTGSAAEEFAYHVQQFKLGALVGQQTAGAANNNHHFTVAPGFVVSVSIGRPVHPMSKTNWEGAGIAPTDKVPAAAALEYAQLMALHRLADHASEPQRKSYNWAIEALEARLHPFDVKPAELQAYAGRYGIRTIRVENDALVLQRDGRPAVKLAPMGPDLFSLARTDQVRVKFKRSGNRIVGFDQVTDEGQIIPSQRDG